jgi:putative FmdB family regulatory protein
MAIYEYDCQACGERFEVRIRATADRTGLKCEHCGSDRVRRRFSAPAVVKKGPSGPQPGELHPVDGRRYTRKLAQGYATGTGDNAIQEVARQVERGDTPTQVQQFVREVKQERETTSKKRGTGT